MNVILLERVSNLGDLGQEVAVKGGYARNFLIPSGKAVRASRENRQIFEARREELEKAANAKLTDASDRAAQLVDRTITIVARASDEGKLYGSVGTADIARALTDAVLPIAKGEVRMPDGVIRAVGEYEVDIHLYADITQSVRVEVVAE